MWPDARGRWGGGERGENGWGERGENVQRIPAQRTIKSSFCRQALARRVEKKETEGERKVSPAIFSPTRKAHRGGGKGGGSGEEKDAKNPPLANSNHSAVDAPVRGMGEGGGMTQRKKRKKKGGRRDSAYIFSFFFRSRKKEKRQEKRRGRKTEKGRPGFVTFS